MGSRESRPPRRAAKQLLQAAEARRGGRCRPPLKLFRKESFADDGTGLLS